jgi:DNA-binding NtrC family response regulator
MSGLPGSEMNGAGHGQTDSPSDASLRERVRDATRRIEAEIIMEALERHRWNRRRTAEALRISYRLLMYKMRNCNLRDIPARQPTPD